MGKVIGIDLGTTFSAIAELDDLGTPEVLADPESGNRITRSAVYFGREKAIIGNQKVSNGRNWNYSLKNIRKRMNTVPQKYMPSIF